MKKKNQQRQLINDFIENNLKGHPEPQTTEKDFRIPNMLLIAALKLRGDETRDYYSAILKDKSDRVLIRLTWAIALLTVVLVVLTIVLIFKG